MNLKKLTDGVLFQAVLTGSLSFIHIHDLAAAHGQAGWKAWLYPLSVDLLTVAAYRKLIHARRTHTPAGLAWFSFLLGLAASLAANVIDSWTHSGRVLAVAIGVWPAIAFLVCTLLGHDPAPANDAASSAEQIIADPAPVPAAAPAAPVAPVQVTNQVATVAPAPPAELPEVPAGLLTWARGIAEQHQRETGSPIDYDTFRPRLGRIAEPLALAIHAALSASPEQIGAGA